MKKRVWSYRSLKSVLITRYGTIIGLMAAIILLSPLPGALSQNKAAPKEPTAEELFLMRFAPGKWFHRIQGEVRSIETVQVRLVKKGGRMVEQPIKTETIYFDRRGFETEMIEGDEGRFTWKYDAEGKVAEMNMYMGGMLFSREVYSYDLRQRKVTAETYVFGSDRMQSRDVSTFDEKWNEIRKEHESFTEDGKRAEQGNYVVVYKNTFDAKGRAVVSTVGGEDGSISYKFTSQYNDSNFMVKGTSYQYDQSSGTLLSTSVSTYDEKGYLLTWLNYDPRGRLLRREQYEREFDASGNWITEKQTTTVYDERQPGSFTIIRRRKITFY